jgi:hypothetical protein
MSEESRPKRSRRPSAKITGELTVSAKKHLKANYVKLAEQGALPAEDSAFLNSSGGDKSRPKPKVDHLSRSP